MNAFICHASEDKEQAERIHLALLSVGCRVFFDEISLPPGQDYNSRIQKAISKSSIFIFLASLHSISHGKYSLSEVAIARKKWPNPTGHVFTVIIDSVEPSSIPPYLAATTFIPIHGNIAADVRAAIEPIVRKERVRLKALGFALLFLCGVSLYATQYWRSTPIFEAYITARQDHLEARLRASICVAKNCGSVNVELFEAAKSCWPKAGVPESTLMIDFMLQKSFSRARAIVSDCLNL